MVSSILQNRLKSLPTDLQDVIGKKVHGLYMKDILDNISIFTEMQAFWKLMQKLTIFCILDYIDENVHQIMSPFYTSSSKTFRQPDFEVFERVMEPQLEKMTSFSYFYNYFCNELNLLFEEPYNGFHWVGQFVRIFNVQNNHLTARKLYSKFSNLKIARTIPENLFHKLVIMEKDSIRKNVIQMYHDPDFEFY